MSSVKQPFHQVLWIANARDHQMLYVETDWSIPITGNGESTIEFNHKQTTIGGGFSLMEW